MLISVAHISVTDNPSGLSWLSWLWMPIPPVLLCLWYTVLSLWLLLLPVKPLKLHCSRAQISLEVIDKEVMFIVLIRKLKETFSSVSYIRIKNTVPLVFKAVFQAYLSEHIAQSCSTEHVSSCACALPFSGICPRRKLLHWGRKSIKIPVDHSLVCKFLY